MTLNEVIWLWDIIALVGLLASLFRGIRSTYRGKLALRLGGNGIDRKLLVLKVFAALTKSAGSGLFLAFGYVAMSDLSPGRGAEPANLSIESYLLFAVNIIFTLFAVVALWLDENIDNDLEALKARAKVAEAGLVEAQNNDNRLTELVHTAREAGRAEGQIEAMQGASEVAADLAKSTIAATLEAQKESTAAMLVASNAAAQAVTDANTALQPSIETNTQAVDANTAATEANTETKAKKVAGEGEQV